MKNIFKQLGVCIITIILGLVSTCLWYNFYDKPSLSYNINTYLFSTPNIDKKNEIQFTFNNNKFKNLYFTMVNIVNDGGIALERDDYSIENNPLKITECPVLYGYIDSSRTTISSKAELLQQNKNMLIRFPYINSGENILIKLIHSEPCPKMDVIGSFKDISNLTRQKTAQELKAYIIKTYTGISIIILLFLISGFYYANKKAKNAILLFYVDENIKSSKDKKKILDKLDKLKTFDERIDYLKSLGK